MDDYIIDVHIVDGPERVRQTQRIQQRLLDVSESVIAEDPVRDAAQQ